MRCKEIGCGGTINERQDFPVKTGCMTATGSHPCNRCGRLHFTDGTRVNTRSGLRAFASPDGIYHKDKTGKIIPSMI